MMRLLVPFCINFQKYKIIKRLNSYVIENVLKTNESLIDISANWPASENSLKTQVLNDMQVYPDFISESEEISMMNELEPILKKMRYEYDHWDDAIHGFRETERSVWKEENATIISRVLSLAFSKSCSTKPLAHTHVLDLAAAGVIKPHVDAVRFCGDVIAGICLCSSAVMRLVHTNQPHLALDALLPRRGLYIMRGVARYDFTHAVLSGNESMWKGQPLVKKRRVAVICRSQPKPENRQP